MDVILKPLKAAYQKLFATWPLDDSRPAAIDLTEEKTEYL